MTSGSHLSLSSEIDLVLLLKYKQKTEPIKIGGKHPNLIWEY